MSFIKVPTSTKMPYIRIKRNDISNNLFDTLRLRKVLNKDDDQSMIFNWAIRTLKNDIEHSMFPARSVVEKFIERMEIYSVNDVANSWKWSVAKDAGEYVLDAIIFTDEHFDSVKNEWPKDENGHYIRKSPYIFKTKWIY